MDKLAILGGKPVRNNKIYYGKQYIDDADVKAVSEALRSELITCGPKVEEFEQELCKITGAKYAVVLANGTAALHAAMFAAGIGKGDEVITSAITFAASANCALYVGAKPIFADIDLDTWNISPEDIEKKITKATKAIVAVDFAGQACDYTKIKEICIKHNLLLIEDAAHSIGSKHNGVPVGNIADMTTFSFHPVKTITGGEGGAILTNNKEYYQKLMLFRTHGITRDEEFLNLKDAGSWYYEQIELGYNYRITDFQAALLISQFRKLPAFAARRREIVEYYNSVFGDYDLVTIQKEISASDTTRHLYILRLNLDKLKATRREIYDAMYAENVCCNVHYIPVYYHPYYVKMGYKKGLCQNAESLYEEIITIPLYYSMTYDDVNDVITAIKKVLEYYRKQQEDNLI